MPVEAFESPLTLGRAERHQFRSGFCDAIQAHLPITLWLHAQTAPGLTSAGPRLQEGPLGESPACGLPLLISEPLWFRDQAR